ncbi:nucleotidyltransferase domain-containing protein [Billgrantia kenyensis]|uniref:Nucleotidyltransferase family protein n=1 Tax=Billgrantia kenyensis TaxID=321266 RepID=A0A7V9W380_9GAMM|nr:nucleotidyltransferase family protein [Halomonas kenyensis]MBA2780240.1 nucleotidyltransferase family protein [Halomonas kenyensis]MCG6663104.1 nucleotidyltransferase family protein [Halomonas kenyensis]
MMRPEYSQPTAELQLLLLFARLELVPSQRDAALSLCARINDWPSLFQQAEAQFILPLVNRHLRALQPVQIPSQHFEHLHRQCLEIAQHGLRIAAIQRQLARKLLISEDVPYLFFKGPALALRYYNDPGLRFCRDIDLLVNGRDMPRLLARALQHGFAPYLPADLKDDRESLEFLCRVQPVITLISPEGVAIEFHQRLDQGGNLYSTSELIEAAEPLTLGDTTLMVMPTEELFLYCCLHHSRHHWSHLHWLVDLDAIQRHPDFDIKAVRACAKRRGLEATLQASLAFYRACTEPTSWQAKGLDRRANDLLASCLRTVQGGKAAELELREQNITADFAFAWQARPMQRIRNRANRLIRPLRPSYSDYHDRPLPQAWQWLYWLTRPLRALRQRFGDDARP